MITAVIVCFVIWRWAAYDLILSENAALLRCISGGIYDPYDRVRHLCLTSGYVPHTTWFCQKVYFVFAINFWRVLSL